MENYNSKIFIGFLFSLLSVIAVVNLRAQNFNRPQILGLAHVSFKVGNLEMSRNYYAKFLGLREAFTFFNSDGSIAVTFFKVNDRQYIELTPNLNPDQVERLNHICFETDNIEGMRNYLASKGVKVPEKLTTGRDRNLHLMVADPEGHAVEFVQMVTRSSHSEAKGKFLGDSRISDRITHAGITVKDAKAEDAFYKDILGFSEIWRGGGTAESPNWINMRIPESTDYIEYMMINEEPTPDRLHSAHHVCLLVPDIQKALETLRDRKSAFEIAPPKIGVNNRWLMNLYDPDGREQSLWSSIQFGNN